jgi:putative ABC transport system ATP-binding protein
MARAIVADPTLLMADEPTGDLDAHSAEEILDILSRLNRDFNKTIILVTHDPRAARPATVTRHLEKGQLHPWVNSLAGPLLFCAAQYQPLASEKAGPSS